MMAIQQMERVIQRIIQHADRNVVLDGDRFASFYADLGREIVGSGDAQRHSQLIKAAYTYVSAQMQAFSLALTGDRNVKDAYTAARTGLYDAFFPPADADALLNSMMAVFGHSPVPGGAAQSPVIDPARLFDALEALDRRHGNELWGDGARLAASLRDEAPGLKQEHRLVCRVYGCAGAEAGALMAKILLNADPEKAVTSLQRTLRRAMIADVYIDGFLGAVLDVFGIEYHPLAQRPQLRQKSAAPGQSPPAAAGSAQSSQQSAGTGQMPPPATSSSAQSGSAKGLWVMLLVAALILAAGSWYVRKSGEDLKRQESPFYTEAATPPSGREPLPTQPQAVYPEVLESVRQLAIQEVDQVVYGSNVTDLSNYARVDRGKVGIMAVPTQLYMNMERGENKSMTANWLRFSGSDGSMLEYLFNTDHPVDLAYYEETLDNMEVLVEAHYDATGEAGSWDHVYLTGTDRENPNLVVHVFMSIYDRCPWENVHMIIKYPQPVSQEDRLIKEYYVECLYRMCEFTRSPNRLRLYRQYLAGVEPEAEISDDRVFSYREDATDVTMTDIRIEPNTNRYEKYAGARVAGTYRSFTGRIPLFRFRYSPSMYDQVSFTNKSEGADVCVEMTGADGSYLYVGAVKTDVIPGDYSKEACKAHIAGIMTNIEVLESSEHRFAAGGQWTYCVRGQDAANGRVTVYACIRKTADAYLTMILKCPALKEKGEQREAEYYAYAVASLCGFTPHDEELMSFMSFNREIQSGG